MIIHKVLRRGTDHSNFCEDAVAIGETQKVLFFAVFDGCSTGKDSHFASTLFAKAFNDIILNLANSINSGDSSLEAKAKFVIYMMMRKIQEIKYVLHIGVDELLSTAVVCSINKETRECIICAFGDGFFSVDGVDTIIKNTRFVNMDNSENRPDYMVYDMHKINTFSEFDLWFSQKSEIHRFENVTNVAIASDGILTFKQFKYAEEVNVLDYLIKDEALIGTKNMLERKTNLLKTKFNMIHQDDLSLIRVKFE